MTRKSRTTIRRVVYTLLFVSAVALIAMSLYLVDWTRRRIDVNNVPREFLFYGPANPQQDSLPLLLVYHGYSGTADGIRHSSKLHEMVDEHDFYLAYLEGNPTWRRPRVDSHQTDVHFFDQLCTHLEGKYPIDRQRIYVAGMSMGGDFAIRLAGLRSKKIAAVVSHAMCTDDVVDAERPFPLMIIVGTEDDRVPQHYLPSVPNRFRMSGHEVELVQPEGMGHRWHRPLNDEIWDFLSKHRVIE